MVGDPHTGIHMLPAARFAAMLLALLAVESTVASAQKLADSAGTYRYEAKSGTHIVSQGTLTITEDSVIVDATPGPCHPVVATSRTRPLIYDCGHVTLSFDRVRPLTRSKATSTRTIYDRQQVCMVESRDTQGRVICAKYGFESVEKTVPVTATVRIIRP